MSDKLKPRRRGRKVLGISALVIGAFAALAWIGGQQGHEGNSPRQRRDREMFKPEPAESDPKAASTSRS